MFTLRNLEFPVERASITGKFENGKLACFVDVDMEPIAYDGESWKPYLYHQGLVINVPTWKSLSGEKIAYSDPNDDNYIHPEIGILYVFGHEPTKGNLIEFGSVENGVILFKWSGTNSLFWDEEFGRNVPFKLECELEITNA